MAIVVIPLGLEPRTLSLKVRCSNQLSYEIRSAPPKGYLQCQTANWLPVSYIDNQNATIK